MSRLYLSGPSAPKKPPFSCTNWDAKTRGFPPHPHGWFGFSMMFIIIDEKNNKTLFGQICPDFN